MKELHPEVYRKFFSENEVVLSMPFNMDWSGFTYSLKYDWVLVEQKIPLRIYIWISASTNVWTILFRNITTYDFNCDSFESKDIIETTNVDSYFAQLSTLIRNKLGFEDAWIVIKVLAEMPAKMNLAFYAYISFLSLTGSLYFYSCISGDQILSASKDNIDKIYYTTEIWSIMREFTLFTKKVSGTFFYPTIANSFFTWSYQTIWFRNTLKNYDKLDEERLQFSLLKTEYLQWTWWLTESKLVHYDFSFDLAIIYSWMPLQSNKYNLDINCIHGYKTMRDDIQNKFFEYKKLHQIGSSNFEWFFLQETTDVDWMLSKLSWIINFEVWYALMSLSINRFKESALGDLIASINKITPLFKIFHWYKNKYLDLLDSLFSYFNDQWNNVWILPFDIGRLWWVFSLVSPLESYRKKIYKFISDYSNDYPDSQMCVIYESRKDWYEYDGIKIEQDIRNWAYSDFIERGNCIIQHYDWSTQLLDHSQVPLQTYDDIIVDTIYHKIYVCWQVLTSKDLHSQTATSEILEIVLQYPDSDVHNAKLPRSAYSKNKNDMTAKITIPLVKLVEKYCNKDLLFTANGSLSNFTIRISPWKVKFGIVKKVG